MYLLTRITELDSDDGWIWRKEVEPDIFIIDKTYGGIQSIWADHYAGIARTNTIVNRATAFEGFSNDGIKNSLLGQAKFLRAYYYFNLVRLFGGVPLIVEEVVTRADARYTSRCDTVAWHRLPPPTSAIRTHHQTTVG